MKKNSQIPSTFTRLLPTIAFSIAYIALPTKLSAAIAPTLTQPWVSGTGSSLLAGAIEWVASGFVFGETPESRTATLDASPSLTTTSGTKTTLTQIGQSTSVNSHRTNADERYGKCNVTVEQIDSYPKPNSQ